MGSEPYLAFLFVSTPESQSLRTQVLEKNGGDDETRTRDLCRDSVAWLGFTTSYKTRGDCQTTRKSYKTSHSVGWAVGWKKAVFLNKRVASPSRGNCFDRTNPRP